MKRKVTEMLGHHHDAMALQRDPRFLLMGGDFLRVIRCIVEKARERRAEVHCSRTQ